MNNVHRFQPASLWRTARRAVAAITAIGSLLGGTLPTQAADGTLLGANPVAGVTQLTMPSPIWIPGALGGHMWIADNGLTFCRLDGPANANGTLNVNFGTCDTTAKSPAQAAFDPATNYVYIADNSTASKGVVRVKFDPASETIVPGSGIVLGDGGTAGRTNSVAFNPADGKVYVGHVKGGTILRIANPNLDVSQQFTEIVGRTTDGRGVRGGMTVVCGAKAGTCDLYIGEVGGNGVSIIANAQACNPFGTGGCQAMTTAITTNLPGGLTSDGTHFIFVGDAPLSKTGTIIRYNVDTDTQDVVSSNVPAYQATYPVPHTQTTYTGATGIAIDPGGNLYVGDDPTVGAALPPPVGQAKLWKIAGAYQSTTQCSASVTSGCIDRLGSPGVPAEVTPPPSVAPAATMLAWGATAPHGALWLPNAVGSGHYWLADHTQGLCRLDTAPDDPGLFASNPSTCDPMGEIGSPGQAVFDPAHNFVYVPDSAVKSPGLWRLNYDVNGTVCKKSDGTPMGPETICNPTLMAPGAGLDNDKLVGVALGPDGNIYAAGLKNAFIYRLTNPSGDPSTMSVDIVGVTADNRGIKGSMGILNGDLYLPEGKGLSVIKNIAGCAVAATNFVPCTAVAKNLPYVPFASSVATDQAHGVVYVAVASGASNATIYRYKPATGEQVLYASRGQLPTITPGYMEDCTTACLRRPDPGMPADGVVGYHFLLGLYVDGAGNLVFGDDVMAGARGFHGHTWSVPYTP